MRIVGSLDDSATGAASEKILSRISLKSSFFTAKIRNNPTKTDAGRSSVDDQIGTRNSRRVNFPRPP